MVVTPMLGSGPDDETLVVSLTGDERAYLNRDVLDPDDLVPTLAALQDDRTDKVLWVKADESLDYGDVLETMNRSRSAGLAGS